MAAIFLVYEVSDILFCMQSPILCMLGGDIAKTHKQKGSICDVEGVGREYPPPSCGIEEI